MSETNDVVPLDLALSEADREALGTLQSVHPAASRLHKINIAIASVFTVVLVVPALAFLIAWLFGER